MKRTLLQILDIEPLFQLLVTKHFNNFRTSLKIANAAKELSQHKAFYIQEERKIVDLYGDKNDKGEPIISPTGEVSFKQNPDNLMKFNKDVAKLRMTEVDIFEPFDVKETDFKEGEMDLTPLQILILSQCINFVDSDENLEGKEA